MEERNLLNVSQFGFWADHGSAFQYEGLAYHVTLHFNNKM
jgi:hypothetical protein